MVLRVLTDLVNRLYIYKYIARIPYLLLSLLVLLLYSILSSTSVLQRGFPELLKKLKNNT